MVAQVVIAYSSPRAQKVALDVVQSMDGWASVAPGVWLVATRMTEADIRDLIRSRAPESQVLVTRLSGGWASGGLDATAQWLRSVRAWF